jgi:hypothetical protein
MTKMSVNPMTVHSIGDWTLMIGRAPASNGDAEAAARRIIDEIYGYPSRSKHKDHDVAELANALVAYAALLQHHGICIVDEGANNALEALDAAARAQAARAARRIADHVDGYDRDDTGESPDY